MKNQKASSELLDSLVSELDTAVGMLLVASTRDPVVKQAMELVSGVSFKLGLEIDEFAAGVGRQRG